MKATLFSILLVIISTLCPPHTTAQDYTRWNLPEGAKVRFGKGIIRDVQFFPDGTRLAVASSIGIWIYDAQTYQEIALLTGHTNSVWRLAFSPDGKTLASGSLDGTIRLWDVATWQHRQILTEDIVTSVVFSPDGKTLASISGSWEGTIHLWDAATGQHKKTLRGHTDAVYSIAFSPDGTTLASGGVDETLRLWDIPIAWDKKTPSKLLIMPKRLLRFTIRRHRKILTRDTGIISTVVFSPDGKTLVSASGSYGNDGIHLWDTTTGQHKQTLTGHTNNVESLAFSPDGKILASGDTDDTIRLWDVTTGQPIQTLTGHASTVYIVAFSPDGKTLASSSDSLDEAIYLWDTTTGQHKKTLTGHTYMVESLAFSPGWYDTCHWEWVRFHLPAGG